MALNANKIPNNSGNGNNGEPELEAGVYPARVVQIIDLGLQPQAPYQGKDKPPAYMISMTYELVDVFMLDEEGNELEDKPLWRSETFPIHNLTADMAKSTKRYNALDPEGVHEGDFSKLLDTPCNVTLVINKKGEKTYVNVASVSAMRPRDSAKCPELKNEARFFDLDDPDLEVFNGLPKWIQEKITSNLEYAGSPLEALLEGKEEKPKKPAPKKKVVKEEQEEEPGFDPDDENEDNPY